MHSMFKYCLGYVTFSNLFVKYPVTSNRMDDFIKNFNVTLRPLKSLPTDSCYYRFRKATFPKQHYDAILALDFEASVARVFTTVTEQEIIEFPCVWIDTKSMKSIKTFHRYVRPVFHPVLDPFCTQLTGITTEMLEKQKPFTEVLEEFDAWYLELKELTKAKKTIFVTCGDWDLKVMLPDQCHLSKVRVPDYMTKWINVKKAYAEVMGKYPRNLKEMVILLGLKRYGRLHRGLDDTVNVVNIVKELARLGHVFVH